MGARKKPHRVSRVAKRSDSVEIEGTKNTSKIEEYQKQFSSALSSMAWQVALTLVGLSVGGIYLDKFLDTRPLFSVIGVLLGVASAMLITFKITEKHFPNTFTRSKK